MIENWAPLYLSSTSSSGRRLNIWTRRETGREALRLHPRPHGTSEGPTTDHPNCGRTLSQRKGMVMRADRTTGRFFIQTSSRRGGGEAAWCLVALFFTLNLAFIFREHQAPPLLVVTRNGARHRRCRTQPGHRPIPLLSTPVPRPLPLTLCCGSWDGRLHNNNTFPPFLPMQTRILKFNSPTEVCLGKW